MVRPKAHCSGSDFDFSIGTIVSAFSLAGHTVTQLPQPVQSSRLTCMEKENSFIPTAGIVRKPSGAAFFSSSLRR